MKKYKIAFYGSSLVSAYWNGAATYYRGIIKYLHQLGHEVTFYEPDAYERQQHRDMQDPDWAKDVVYAATEAAALQALEAGAREADILIKASGVGVFDELLEREILNARQPHQLLIFWDVDAPATLQRLQEHPQDAFHAILPKYDMVLTYGGGDPVVHKYKTAGAKYCIPVYNALDPETHHPVKPNVKFAGTLSFLGNRLSDREHRVEEFFLKPAALLPQQSFLLGGSGWHDKPMSENVKYLGHIYTHEHNAFNCTPLAVLNISRDSMAENGFSPATRVFEAAGASACLITDAWEGIELFLEPEKEVLVAHNGTEVAEILASLTPQRAENIGRAALRRITGEHTYAHRATQVEAIFHEMMGTHQKSTMKDIIL
ncbi:MAG: glycosyltransferase [Saprospiraceae bacterium]